MLVTSISRDGTMDGPDVGLIEEVRRLAPEMALIASGGVGDLRDLQTLAEAGCEAAIVGRALYEKRFTIEEARRSPKSRSRRLGAAVATARAVSRSGPIPIRTPEPSQTTTAARPSPEWASSSCATQVSLFVVGKSGQLPSDHRVAE